MPQKKENLVRTNSRIRKDQDDFVKAYSKNQDMSEGEVHRLAIDDLMSKVGKIKQKKNAK